MALDPIAITVREGDSFDELYLNIEKPWGKPYDYSQSVLVADIRRFFNTAPNAVVGSFGIVEINPTGGVVQLRLTSRQTEALGRNVDLGYEERNLVVSGLSSATDFSDELQGKFLWDLREYFSVSQATISGISSGTAFTVGGVSKNRVRITTTNPHLLTEQDIILISGTTLPEYDGVNFSANTLTILSKTVFEITPTTTTGTPAFSVGASAGTISVYKEDTLAIGTLEVIPRISRDSVI